MPHITSRCFNPKELRQSHGDIRGIGWLMNGLWFYLTRGKYQRHIAVIFPGAAVGDLVAIFLAIGLPGWGDNIKFARTQREGHFINLAAYPVLIVISG